MKRKFKPKPNNTDIERKPNELTDHEFLKRIINKFVYKHNKNKQPFTMNDINQYCLKGKLPDIYGGNELTIRHIGGKIRLTIIANFDPTPTKPFRRKNYNKSKKKK